MKKSVNLGSMKRVFQISAALAMLVALSSCADKAAKIDKELKSWFRQDEPGVAVLVMRSDTVLFQGCYGLADMETKARVTPQTNFNIASVSKQFTATAVMQLAEEGKLLLTDPVGDYFPEYTDPLWQKVQIRHLMSHTSGIPDLRDYPREVKIKGDDNLAIEYMQTLDTLLFEPGTDYRYTNPTYVLLGRLIERVSGQPFEEYMAEHIFAPAGMTNTCYFGPEKEIPDMAHAYNFIDEIPRRWPELDYGEDTFFATRPDGGIYTSIEDLSKWIPALVDGKIVSSKSLEALWTPFLGMKDGEGYGYGFGVMERDSLKIIYHFGGNGAFRSAEAYYPEQKGLILILAAQNYWDRDVLWKKLEDAFILGKE